MTVIFWMFIICKMLKENSWYWFISLVDVQVYWLGLFKSFCVTVSYKKKRNNFFERKVSNPSVWSCQKNNLLFVVHVSYFSIISSKRWSKNAFLFFSKNYLFLLLLLPGLKKTLQSTDKRRVMLPHQHQVKILKSIWQRLNLK